MDMKIKGSAQLFREFKQNGTISKNFEKRVTYAINESAFRAREGTRAYLQSVISNPTPFTLRTPYVTKAKTTSQKATVQSLDKQDAYLRNLESGGVNENNRIPLRGTGDKYGNLRKKFQQSNIKKLLEEEVEITRTAHKIKERVEKARAAKKVASSSRKRDKSGRLLPAALQPKNVIVSVPKISEIKAELGTRKIGLYYIGGANGRGGKKGLWKRVSDNRSRQLIYLFRDRQRYESGSIKLKDFWTREASRVMDEEFDKDWLAGYGEKRR